MVILNGSSQSAACNVATIAAAYNDLPLTGWPDSRHVLVRCACAGGHHHQPHAQLVQEVHRLHTPVMLHCAACCYVVQGVMHASGPQQSVYAIRHAMCGRNARTGDITPLQTHPGIPACCLTPSVSAVLISCALAACCLVALPAPHQQSPTWPARTY